MNGYMGDSCMNKQIYGINGKMDRLMDAREISINRNDGWMNR